MNPTDMCKRTNQLIVPEYVVHGALVLFLLICGYWFAVLLNLPVLALNIYKYANNDTLVVLEA